MKFTVVFATIGLLISILFSQLGSNGWMSTTFAALICTLVSAALGAGTYKLLEERVPEFLALLRRDMDTESFGDGEFENTEFTGEMGSEELPDDGQIVGTADAVDTASSPALDTTTFGDHILVNKIKIKNEPKLMARAIRNMLAKDED